MRPEVPRSRPPEAGDAGRRPALRGGLVMPFAARCSASAPFIAALIASGCASDWPPPPETRVEVVTDTIHGVEIPDPYRWLEDQDSPETRAWIDAQNEYARRIVSDTALEARLAARLSELMEVAQVSAPREAGAHELFTLRRPGELQARIYRREKPEREPTGERPDPAGEYELLLDAQALGFDGWASIDIVDISPDGKLLLYRIRDGGLDEIMVRLFDLETLEDRPERLPEALYGNIAFDGKGEGFYYVHRSRQDGPRARYHRIGTEMSEDREIFGEGYGPETFLRLEEIEDGRLLLLGVQHGWMRNDVFVMDRSSGEVHPVIEGERAHVNARYEEGRLLLTTDLDASNYRVVAIPTAGVDPSRWSDRSRWSDWIPEQEHLLRGYTTIGDRTYVELLANVASRILVFEAGDGTALEPVDEVPLPEFHTASLSKLGEDGAMLTLSSFAVPQTRYRLDLETWERDLIEPPRPEYDGSGVLVEQVWYTSKDGTEAPMYIMRPRGVELDGNLPTLLHGYGGFNVSVTPSFRAQAAVWVEAGGVFAVATLRGGSEFGEDWHRAGMLENKQNVFDDFISSAEWLIGHGYTNPDRLAIMGGSNGGLLVASSFTQRPELYRAVYCGFPDLDMVRFYTFTETNNMPALLEYGNAGIPEQFEFLRQYSPYQAVEDGTDYPAVMFTQGDLDTRVPPLQGRKMAARVQAASTSGLPVILRYRPRAGHAGGRSRVPDRAMDTAFLMMQLGMSYGEGEPES
ncbi:MAG: S9 family peptidase [Acidobacteria bacterium]|nr:S9 family peptidase [Acidobacteriota bacterium]MYG75668.1 S9 family peptidase [Acidobacteriota bacterium]